MLCSINISPCRDSNYNFVIYNNIIPLATSVINPSNKRRAEAGFRQFFSRLEKWWCMGYTHSDGSKTNIGGIGHFSRSNERNFTKTNNNSRGWWWAPCSSSVSIFMWKIWYVGWNNPTTKILSHLWKKMIYSYPQSFFWDCAIKFNGNVLGECAYLCMYSSQINFLS